MYSLIVINLFIFEKLKIQIILGFFKEVIFIKILEGFFVFSNFAWFAGVWKQGGVANRFFSKFCEEEHSQCEYIFSINVVKR